jgi:hypothetical protein
MRIDQRNAGASVTASSIGGFVYTLDRWNYYAEVASKFTVQQNAGSVTPPVGFSNYLGVTSSSAYTLGANDIFSITQSIEGFNTADLAWGTANAKTITISFWVRSSLTGTFGGSILNSAYNRSYPFTYTISAANTWEQKTVTIAGDTSGTWIGSTNGAGIRLFFSLGAGSTYSGTAGAWAGSQLWSATGATSVIGTNAATWYVTGVQLEQNTSATPFERRMYGQELINCQRYYQLVSALFGGANSSTTAVIQVPFQVQMRAGPTLGLQGVIQLSDSTNDYTQSSTNISNLGTTNNTSIFFLGNFTGLTTSRVLVGPRNSANTNTVTLSAEL